MNRIQPTYALGDKMPGLREPKAGAGRVRRLGVVRRSSTGASHTVRAVIFVGQGQQLVRKDQTDVQTMAISRVQPLPRCHHLFALFLSAHFPARHQYLQRPFSSAAANRPCYLTWHWCAVAAEDEAVLLRRMAARPPPCCEQQSTSKVLRPNSSELPQQAKLCMQGQSELRRPGGVNKGETTAK